MVLERILSPESYDCIGAEETVWGGWMDPCATMLAVDFQEKTGGLIAHVRDVYPTNPRIKEFLTEVRRMIDERMRLLIRGAHHWSTNGDGMRVYMEERRRLLLFLIAEAGIPPEKLEIAWGKDDHISNLGYEASTGTVLYREEYQEK